MNKVKALVCGAALLQCVVAARSAHAGILSNLDLSQEVLENDLGNGTGHGSSLVVTAITTPFYKSATVTDQSGGLEAAITANYSVTDNGSVAALSINSSGFLDPNGYGVEESSDNGRSPAFYLTQPCRYTATFSCAGPSYAELDYTSVALFGTANLASVSNSTKTYSGTVGAGPFDLLEDWSLSNAVGPTNQSGTDSISITFYATEPLPEPSSALLIGVPALALLARRRRPGSTSQLLGQDNE